MKEFPLEQIEGTREYFKAQGFPVEEAQLGDLQVSYWVIPQGLNPGLQDFALRMTKTDPETGEVSGIFGVSDSVPAELRPYWAAHEIIEFTKIGIGQDGRCKLAEERAVGLVPPGLRDAFIGRRAMFFTNLTNFFKEDLKANTGNYTPADLQEAEASLSFLQQLKPL